MEEPTYHLAGVMHTRDELPADFDGPLSVILLLLSKNKIEIQDVSITSILEQYLAYLDEMKRLDMEIASEFIAMASHLMLIKTKMLLSAAEREEAMSEMELLIRSLEEKQRAEAYEQIRTAVAFLEPRSDIGNGFFPHAPQPLRPDATYRYRHEPQAQAILRKIDVAVRILLADHVEVALQDHGGMVLIAGAGRLADDDVVRRILLPAQAALLREADAVVRDRLRVARAMRDGAQRLKKAQRSRRLKSF